MFLRFMHSGGFSDMTEDVLEQTLAFLPVHPGRRTVDAVSGERPLSTAQSRQHQPAGPPASSARTPAL